MEASEKKVSTRVRGAAWRRKDAPKARGCVFLGKTRRGAEEMSGEVDEREERVERERSVK